MTEAARSALTPIPFRPTWEVGAALGVHVLLAGMLWAQDVWFTPDAPMIDPSDVMQVQMVALPKQTTRLPDKPMRTPDPPKGAPTEAPTPPPPPTASDMVLHKDDAPPDKGQEKPPDDRTKEREELLKKMQKDQLLKDMSAAIGPDDKVQTSPDGVDPADAILGPGSGKPMDPELARYVSQCRQAILPNWTPLPATVSAHPDYLVAIFVEVSEDGALGTPTVVKGTGDASFDRSALMAVIKTQRLPPPPAKYRDSAAKGVQITLSARDL